MHKRSQLRYRLLAAVLWLLPLTLSPQAQGQALLSPIPCQQFLSATGAPLAGGFIYTYLSGTTTLQSTYTDSTATNVNTNPVLLDSAGYPANGSARTCIWLQSGQLYRFKVVDKNRIQQYQVDGIGGILNSGNNPAQATTTVSYVATPTFSSIAQDQLFLMTLTGNVSSSTLSMAGISAPAQVTYELTQDNTGNRSFAWPVNVIGGCTISGTANTTTTQSFSWDGTNAVAVGPCQVSTGGWIITGQVSGATLTGASTGNSVTKVTSIDNSGAITGTNAAANVFSYTLPAKTMQAGKGVRISWGATHTGAASPVYAFNFGSLNLPNLITASGGNISGSIVVMNKIGLTNAQTVTALTMAGSSAQANAASGGTVDTTSNVTITITFNVANTDTVTPIQFVVQQIQ